jgi:single-strand DNA-binding protein
MASFNKVILVGNLTRDVDLRFTPKGTAIAKLGIAVNRVWRNETGESKEEVTFVDVDAFGKQAETIANYLKKGSPLLVEGRLRLDQWDDKQTGQKRSRLGVVLESFQFLGGARVEGTPEGPRRGAAPQQNTSATAAQRSAPASEPDGPPPEDDDVPF